MEAVLVRYLSSASVRDFLLRRTPEGSVPNLNNSLTFTYTGVGSSPIVRTPKVCDTFVVHKVHDGVALGEILTYSFEHPILPTLNSVIAKGEVLSNATVTSRRFAVDLLAQDRVECLEFAWLSDLRVLISWRWTFLAAGMPFAIDGECRLYPPSTPGNELTVLWDVPQIRMSYSGQVCRSCGASHFAQCTCDPCVVADRTTAERDIIDLLNSPTTPSPPNVVPSAVDMTSRVEPRLIRTWAAWCDAFKACQSMGSLRVIYRRGIPINPGSLKCVHEELLSDGFAKYGIGCSVGSFGEGLSQQVQLYMSSTHGLLKLLQEPSLNFTDEPYLLTDCVDSESQFELDPIVPDGSFGSLEISSNSYEVGCLWSDKDDFGRTRGMKEGSLDSKDPRDSSTWLSSIAPDDLTNVPLIKVEKVQEITGQLSASVVENEQRLTTGIMKRRDSDVSKTVCNRCGARFTRPANLRRHCNTIHMNSRSKTHDCPKCSRSFFNAVELKRHMSNHEKPRLECPRCGLRFRLANALELHVSVVHSQGRPFKCECGAAFARKSAYLRHVKSVHKRERYCCSDCDASYSQPFDLKMHKRRSGHGRDDNQAEGHELSTLSEAQ